MKIILMIRVRYGAFLCQTNLMYDLAERTFIIIPYEAKELERNRAKSYAELQ